MQCLGNKKALYVDKYDSRLTQLIKAKINKRRFSVDILYLRQMVKRKAAKRSLRLGFLDLEKACDLAPRYKLG